MRTTGPLTNVEKSFAADDIIVSKTDGKGLITYANRTFLEVSEYAEDEILGKPHNIIRHPDMPRCIFRLLWERIQSGREIFAYVLNRTRLGNHYWVLAHVTPSFDAQGRVVGYHSNRRVPDRPALEETIRPLYGALLARERSASDPRAGMEASTALLRQTLENKGVDYDQFVFSL